MTSVQWHRHRNALLGSVSSKSETECNKKHNNHMWRLCVVFFPEFFGDFIYFYNEF